MKKCPDVATLSTFSDCCDSLEVYYNGPLEYTLNSIYGYYVRQEDLIHGRPWYKNDGESIWWDDKYSDWSIGDTISKWRWCIEVKMGMLDMEVDKVAWPGGQISY